MQLQFCLLHLGTLLHRLTLNLRVKLRNLHGFVLHDRWLRNKLLSGLVDLSQLLSKATKLIFNELLDFQDHCDLLVCIFFDQLFTLSHVDSVVSFYEVVVQQVVTQVCGNRKHVCPCNYWVATKQGGLQEREVGLEVSHVVLPWDDKDRATHGGGNILADGVYVLRAGLCLQHLIRTDLQIAKEHLLHFPLVIHLRNYCRPLHDRLNLRKPLCFTEDSWIADRDDIHRAIKVRRLNL